MKDKEYWKKDIEEFMRIERWFTIPEYKGYYEVSNYGNIKGLDRYANHNYGGKYKVKGKIRVQKIREDGYPAIILHKNCKGKEFKVHVIMRKIFFNNPEMDIDHIDRVRSNNKLSNLRMVTKSQNLCNSTKRKNCSSKYRGVSLRKDTKKWQAFITVEGRRRVLGCFETEEEGAREYDRASKVIHGEFGNLNFPEDKSKSDWVDFKNKKRKSLNSISKYHGITFDKRKLRWYANIKNNNKKNTYIGSFTNEIDAAKAYDKKAKELNKPNNFLNFPEPKPKTEPVPQLQT